jgi:phospholipase C
MGADRLSEAVHMHRILFAVAASVLALSTVAGSARALPRVQSPEAAPIRFDTSTPIKHIIIIIQENRSFDNLFNGFPNADTVQTGKMHTGQTIALHSWSLSGTGDPGHNHTDWVAAYDGGKMDGFDLEDYYNGNPVGTFPYAYVPESDVAPYWTLASEFTLADRMFQSNTGPSFPAHQYLIAGQADFVSSGPNHYPWGCDAPAGTWAYALNSKGQQVKGPYPCFTYLTLGDLLDKANVRWRLYTPQPLTNWNPYQAIHQIRFGADWNDDISSPSSNILTDISGGTLAKVSWVIPTTGESDHPEASGGGMGPDWVASITNAVGASKYWDNTAIFITWDDWGGWYDHVQPPQLDLMGLSMRVPLIVVSPYAKTDYVSHVNYEFGSILKFVEQTYGLPSLGTTDARANPLTDCFNFAKSPTPYRQVATRVSPWYFLHDPNPYGAPDDY